MATFERQIDALGGQRNEDGEYNAGYADGYSSALADACLVGADADVLVDELLEAITDMLDGGRTLERWTADARLLVNRVKHRMAS